MRRKPSAAEDRLDPRELVERYTAEHSLPTVRTGRRRRAAESNPEAPAPTSTPSALATVTADHDSPREPALLTHSTLLAEAELARPTLSTAAELARPTLSTAAELAKPTLSTAAELALGADPELGTDTAPHGFLELDPEGEGPPPLSPMTGMPVIEIADLVAGHTAAGTPRPPGSDEESVVEREAPEPRRHGRRRAPRSRLRRLAPPAVGAAAVLVATMVVMMLKPASDEGPDLSASLVSSDTAQGAPGTSSTGVAPIPAPGGLANVVGEAKERATTTTNPPPAAAPAARGAGRGAGAAAPLGDGSTAAGRFGWRQTGGDEFDSGLGKWGPYDGAGHDGNGRRTPNAISTNGGVLTITGDGNGNTGGMMFNQSQRFGRYEMRAKFPAGDSQYHPVLILWPTDMGWPEGGEVDFAETNSAAKDVSFFLHYGAANNQVSENRNLDITQWHNYAVEWTSAGVVGYIDGQEWFRSTTGNPPGKMAPTIQLDYFPDGGSPRTSQMQVDWMRIYAA
jgi:hypothetical protein